MAQTIQKSDDLHKLHLELLKPKQAAKPVEVAKPVEAAKPVEVEVEKPKVPERK